MRKIGKDGVEWARYLLERLVVVPSAGVLPRAWALRVADVVGWLDITTPTGRRARREIEAATGLRGREAGRLTRQRLAGPRRDLVLLRRMRRGREHPSQWTIVEVNPEPVRELLAANRPFLTVSGHFSDVARLMRTKLLPAESVGVSAAIPHWRLSPHVLRERLQNHLLYGLRRKLAGLDPVSPIPLVGEGNVQGTLLEKLSQTGGIGNILIDAWWEKPNAHRRPFAGLGERGFALGAARIARLAQCPMVLYVATFDDDRTVRVEWSDPIEPPPVDDKASDIAVMDRLIDELERWVARYPTQYFHPMGFERAWNAGAQRWEPVYEGAASAVSPVVQEQQAVTRGQAR